jgi:dihydrofolate synthase/folylpolyglutamate synthase
LKLETFLSNKPLFYKKFDPLRIRHAYNQIKDKLRLPRIVHMIGTNGKGTTGRFLAQMLQQAGVNVGHYTSPHINTFNERIWIDGDLASDDALDRAYDELTAILDQSYQESLSYFEFTTLVAMIAFKACDFVVLEAGLGGEYDATSVFPNELTLLTPIGLDHADFLGDTIEDVATTKIKGVQKHAITALQQKEVMLILEKLSAEKGFSYESINLDNADRALVESFQMFNGVDYLADNFSLALAALRHLGFTNSLEVAKVGTLFGRLTLLEENLMIDVGHNILAAQQILNHFGKTKVNLVYNTLSDKAYIEILALLKPIIKKLFIIDISDERALEKDKLQTALGDLDIAYENFTAVDRDQMTLVFGSFVVVETFLKMIKK